MSDKIKDQISKKTKDRKEIAKTCDISFSLFENRNRKKKSYCVAAKVVVNSTVSLNSESKIRYRTKSSKLFWQKVQDFKLFGKKNIFNFLAKKA